MTDYQRLVNESYQSIPKYSEIMAGVPEDHEDIKTLGDLLAVNYKLVGSRDQLRSNLRQLIKKEKEGNGHQSKYPGILGFDDDVVPALDRAILSGHDIFLVGQIGQAKTKLVEIIASTLLSPVPVIQGSITNDCPMDLPAENLVSLLNDQQEKREPVFYVSPESEDKIRDNKLDTPIEWKGGLSRYKYVLATPDISVKDLVGYIDAVKVAKKGVEMYEIDSYSPGQLMQSKHGIFCIDELPVLDPRKQVALLSVLQEGRFTTGSYPVTFKPQTTFFATANPIDYTHSGKIIEPLYDRLKSHIHTHYPTSIEDEMKIILQEANIADKSQIAAPVLKILAAIVQKTRQDPKINQEKGVSVRLGIHGLELLTGEAERARGFNGISASPRITDMHCLDQVAKFELSEMDDTIENRRKVFQELVNECIKKGCIEYLANVSEDTLSLIKEEFGENSFQVSQRMHWKNGQTSYSNQLENFANLKRLVESKFDDIKKEQELLSSFAGKDAFEELWSVMTEIILEGLCWVQPKVLDKREAGYVATK